MKSYTITVNGTAYEVTVEETGAAAPAAAPRALTPKSFLLKLPIILIPFRNMFFI